MVATSVAVIRSRNESMWERREAATCVRRERKKGGRKGKEEERQRNDRMQYSGKFSPVAGQTIVHLLFSNYQSSFSIYE